MLEQIAALLEGLNPPQRAGFIATPWNRIVPPRVVGRLIDSGDDSQILQALNTLPSLALPPAPSAR